MSLGLLTVISRIWALGKQHTSHVMGSGQQMGPSIPLRSHPPEYKSFS